MLDQFAQHFQPNCHVATDLQREHVSFIFITARKRSLGQGNIFTPVCHSVHGGSASVHAGIPPPRPCPPGIMHPPGPCNPPGTMHPPGTEHAGRYGQRAGGTHPTEMQSCLEGILLKRLFSHGLNSLFDMSIGENRIIFANCNPREGIHMYLVYLNNI